MSPVRKPAWRAVACFPRVSGDEPVDANMLTPSVEFSPRERG